MHEESYRLTWNAAMHGRGALKALSGHAATLRVIGRRLRATRSSKNARGVLQVYLARRSACAWDFVGSQWPRSGPKGARRSSKNDPIIKNVRGAITATRHLLCFYFLRPTPFPQATAHFGASCPLL